MVNYLLGLAAAIAFMGCAKTQTDQGSEIRQKEAETATAPVFDGKRAFGYLTAQTNFGPRNPGSPGHRNCLSYIQSEMQSVADAVNPQPFTVTGYKKEVLKLTNVIASFNLKSTSRILLVAHWDSRPRAEQDKDPKKKALPILGANDGASGVAVLLELAQHLKRQPPEVGVDFLFVDGEDYGEEGDTKYYLLGARYFAQNLPVGFAPRFGILLDMIGDAHLEIPKDRYSLEHAPDIVELVWSAARDLKVHQFVDSPSRTWTTDDHVPLNEAGIKCIDLIDFEYPDASNKYWHTTEDTPDKCSAESLEAVGKVLLRVIYSAQE